MVKKLFIFPHYIVEKTVPETLVWPESRIKQILYWQSQEQTGVS